MCKPKQSSVFESSTSKNCLSNIQTKAYTVHMQHFYREINQMDAGLVWSYADDDCLFYSSFMVSISQ